MKDFLGTEVTEECGKVELSLRLLAREWFDETKGDEGLIFEGVRNEVRLAVTDF